MSSVLHFTPAFQRNLSLSGLADSGHEPSKKRKRGIESLDDDGVEVEGRSEGLEAEFLPSGYPNSDAIFTTLSAVPDLEKSHGGDALHSQTSSRTDREVSHASNVRQSSPHHHIVPLMGKGLTSDKLATLKAPLYVPSGRIPVATAEVSSGSIGLRQHHLNTITAVLHRCLSECDHIRARRAWAILLRAEQHGQSMDLRTYDRWGLGAEILMHCNSQLVPKTLDYKVVENYVSTSHLGVKPGSIEQAKEYYEMITLQYPYHKALPNAIGALNFSIAIFSLWLHAIKERSSILLKAISSSNENADDFDVEANDIEQSSSASHIKSNRFRKREQVRRDTLQSAHEIAAQLDRLLVSPPYSDNAMLRKLCGEISLWIADISVATAVANDGSCTSGKGENMTVESSFLL